MDNQKIRPDPLKASIDWIEKPVSAGDVWERQIRIIGNGPMKQHM